MIKTVYLENFKCYGPEGTRFDLAPLTFIYGDNSAGKSTFFQALGLLKNSAEKAQDVSFTSQFYDYVFKHDLDKVIGIGATITDKKDSRKIFLKLHSPEKKVKPLEIVEPNTKNNYDSIKQAIKDNLNHHEAERPSYTGKLSADGSLLSLLTQKEFSIDKMNELLKKLNIPYSYKDEGKLHDHLFDIEVNESQVGAGIDTIIDVLEHLLKYLTPGKILLLEEPEMHLHPKYLGEFCKVLVEEVMLHKGSQLIVECHSEHMILKLQNLIRAKHDGITKDDVSILYVERCPNGSKVTPIQIDSKGRLDHWPNGFFMERTKLIREKHDSSLSD